MPTTMEKPRPKHSASPAQRNIDQRRQGDARRRRQEQPGIDLPKRYQPNYRHRSGTQQPIGRRRTIPRTVPATYEPRYARASVRKKRSKLHAFFHPFSLEKGFTLLGLAVGAVMSILFAIDLIFAWPFMRASTAFDVTFMLSGLAMIALSLDVAKDQARGRCNPPSNLGAILTRSW